MLFPNRISGIHLLTLVFTMWLGLAASALAQCGAPQETERGPIGGGDGYHYTIDRADAAYIVTNTATLLNALSQARFGEVIYCEDAAVIDLEDHYEIQIPAGVTLASGRGVNGSEGALLTSPRARGWSGTRAVFLVTTDDVRITGLRLGGPHPYYGTMRYGPIPNDFGIQFRLTSSGLVDNCEIWGFTKGIVFEDAIGGQVLNCHIHHCMRRGLGYGVNVVYRSEVLIEGCRLNANRHGIAGSGHPGQRYEARFNVFGPCSRSTQIDMHGACDRGHFCPDELGDSDGDGYPDAGELIIVTNNTFHMDQNCINSITIRGVPTLGAVIQNNAFTQAQPELSIGQMSWFFRPNCAPCTGGCTPSCYPDPGVNMFIADNCYGVPGDLECAGLDPPRQVDAFIESGSWTTRGNGSRGWYIGDYDGDGMHDLLQSYGDAGTGTEVLLSLGDSFAPQQIWSEHEPDEQGWYVGDFNGDGRDDLLRYHAGVAGAEVLLSTGTAFEPPQDWTAYGNWGRWYVGDFDGDGLDDIARFAPATGATQVLRSTGTRFQMLGDWTSEAKQTWGWFVGDFNGDGLDDLLQSEETPTQWEQSCGTIVLLSNGAGFDQAQCWSDGGLLSDRLGRFEGVPCHSMDAMEPSEELYIADMNGDGADDFFRYSPHNSGAEVFLSNRSQFHFSGSWTRAGYISAQGWYVGDYDGNGRPDLLRYGQGSGGYVFLAKSRTLRTAPPR